MHLKDNTKFFHPCFFVHLSFPSSSLGTCSTKKVHSTSIGVSITPESIKKTLQTPTDNDQSPTEYDNYYELILNYLYIHVPCTLW